MSLNSGPPRGQGFGGVGAQSRAQRAGAMRGANEPRKREAVCAVSCFSHARPGRGHTMGRAPQDNFGRVARLGGCMPGSRCDLRGASWERPDGADCACVQASHASGASQQTGQPEAVVKGGLAHALTVVVDGLQTALQKNHSEGQKRRIAPKENWALEAMHVP